MQKNKYTVALMTPIGIRNGIMDIQIRGRTASGIIHILGKAQPFSGEIDEGGKCKFSGKIETLKRIIFYDAIGIVTRDKIELSLKGNAESFRLMGERLDRISTSM